MNRIQTTADRHIYNDIVRKICIGAYNYGDKVAPIRELCEYYHFAPTTVKKAMKQLRQDGFIKGETSKGTHIIFDCNNTEHVERLKANAAHATLEAYNNLPIPAILFSSMVAMGIEAASDAVRQSLVNDLDYIVSFLSENSPFIGLAEEFFRKAVAQTNNPFMLDIFEDLASHFVFFVPFSNSNHISLALLRKEIASYCLCLKNMLQTNDFDHVKSLTFLSCKNICAIPNVILLSLDSEGVPGLQREKLYSKVIQTISVEILSGKIKKGEFFQSTPGLCKKYGVSRKTISKAYEILEILKLIKVVPYKGAQLVVDLNEPDVRLWMEEMLNQWSQDIFYALEVLRMIGFDIFRELAAHATGEVVERMKQNLERQWANTKEHHMFMLITDALGTPLVLTLSSSMMHRHYDFLISFLIKFVAACSFQLQESKTYAEWQQQAYCEATEAIKALKAHDADGFIAHFTTSLKFNDKMYQALHNANFQWFRLTRKR